MNRQFFLSAGRIEPSARWCEAFSDDRALDFAALVRHAEPHDVIWLSAADPDWEYALAALRADVDQCPIVVLSTSPDSRQAARALDLGARGYCHAYAVPALLREVSVVVAHGGLWIGAELMAHMVKAASRMLPARPDPSLTELLSEREAEVVEAVIRGLSNKEVAARLGITERTVKAHLGSVFKKLDVRDRLQLVLRLADERMSLV